MAAKFISFEESQQQIKPKEFISFEEYKTPIKTEEQTFVPYKEAILPKTFIPFGEAIELPSQEEVQKAHTELRKPLQDIPKTQGYLTKEQVERQYKSNFIKMSTEFFNEKSNCWNEYLRLVVGSPAGL